MKNISKSLLDDVSHQAKESARLRKNFNFHETAEDTLHRMLNALEPDTYVQPHMHKNPDKREAFVILRGKALVITFDNEGKVTARTVIEPGGENLGVEIPAGEYHTIIALKPGTVVYEVKDGPYKVSDDKNFAPWAPAEGDADAQVYLQRLVDEA
jgi:cupin fold WbuC family metalloprotein